MMRVLCLDANNVKVEFWNGDTYYSRHVTAADARRLAAELIVAAERAERLESDQRAPG